MLQTQIFSLQCLFMRHISAIALTKRQWTTCWKICKTTT